MKKARAQLPAEAEQAAREALQRGLDALSLDHAQRAAVHGALHELDAVAS